MARTSWGSAHVGGAVACDQLQEPAEGLEARQDGDTIGHTPAGYRLLRVLIVDDYRDAADSLALLLKIWGHDVRLAYDGASAFEMTSAYRPNVLLLDIAMPKMDGFRLAQQLRRQTRFQDTLLIAVTGYADLPHRRLWEGAFDHYLVKPVDLSTLEALLTHEQDRLADSAAAASVTPRKYGILAVDDEGAVRGMLDVGLRQHGFAVWPAASGREALDLYRRHRDAIDVVLMDVRMPDLDGPQTLAALQGLNPRVRCCFMSGDTGRYTEEQLCGSGAGFVPKPFRLAEVVRVLGDLASSTDPSPSGV